MALTPFDPTSSEFNRGMAMGHQARKGHALRGYYAPEVYPGIGGGLVRECCGETPEPYAYDYGYEANPHSLDEIVVYLLNSDTGEVLDSIGADVPFDISDHGNTNVSPEIERVLYDAAAELAAENHGALIGRRP